jgi:drug/metabolite transporter (DMT)-like permease
MRAIVTRVHGALAAGMVAAGCAAACYEVGYALQARASRRAPAELELRPRLLGALAGQRLWVVGVALAVLGWPLQLLALHYAPLTVVQPTLALGLVLLLALAARYLGERVRARHVLAVVAVVMGVAAIAWAAPARTTGHASGPTLAGALGLLALVALAPYLVRGRGGSLIVGAGAADAWAAFGAKLVVDELSAGRWLRGLAWGAGAALALGLGLLSEMTALRRFAASTVGPIVVVMQIAVPVALAPLVGGELWGGTPLGGAVLVAALVLVTGAAAVLASTAAGVLEHD